LGIFYPRVIEILESIKKETGILIKGFSDMTEKEISALCGLSLEEAEFAKKREYDEPFVIEGGEKGIDTIKKKIEEKGMNYVWGGKFHHLLGKNDKGRAVEILEKLYENEFFSIATVGIGDSPNDFPMLLAVDHPIFLGENGGLCAETLRSVQNLITINGTGPEAWNQAILNKINELAT
jgi:mannosyl-3-phosphoglycerate phosphatase